MPSGGGPDNGHTYLLDSNLDWGQDFLTLRDYMQKENIDKVSLAYFGRVDPAIYGINYIPLIGDVGERFAVISANLLWGRMYFVTGTSLWPNRDYYAAFRTIRPKAILGHTLYVFDRKRPDSRDRIHPVIRGCGSRVSTDPGVSAAPRTD